MSASLHTTNFIPGNYVTKSLADLQMAVRANPGLSVIGICADAGLGGVLDTSFDLASTKSEPDGS